MSQSWWISTEPPVVWATSFLHLITPNVLHLISSRYIISIMLKSPIAVH